MMNVIKGVSGPFFKDSNGYYQEILIDNGLHNAVVIQDRFGDSKTIQPSPTGTGVGVLLIQSRKTFGSRLEKTKHHVSDKQIPAVTIRLTELDLNKAQYVEELDVYIANEGVHIPSMVPTLQEFIKKYISKVEDLGTDHMYKIIVNDPLQRLETVFLSYASSIIEMPVTYVLDKTATVTIVHITKTKTSTIYSADISSLFDKNVFIDLDNDIPMIIGVSYLDADNGKTLFRQRSVKRAHDIAALHNSEAIKTLTDENSELKQKLRISEEKLKIKSSEYENKLATVQLENTDLTNKLNSATNVSEEWKKMYTASNAAQADREKFLKEADARMEQEWKTRKAEEAARQEEMKTWGTILKLGIGAAVVAIPWIISEKNKK